MRIRPFVYAFVALVGALPVGALAHNASASLSLPPGDVAAGATIPVNCWVEAVPGSGPFGAVAAVRIDVTVDGGTVVPAQLTGAVSQPCSNPAFGTCSVISGTATWTTPPAAGTYTATCTGVIQPFSGGPVLQAATASVTTVASATLPPSVGAIDGPGEVAIGTASTFQVAASDPNDPALPLTYAWTATGGTVTQDPANPAAASWQAPAQPGVHELTVTVSNGASSIPARKSVNVVLASYQASLPVSVAVPRRIASGAAGELYVVDGRQSALGQVVLVTRRGEVRGFATLPEPALAVASGAGVLWVTTTKGSIYKVDPATGRTLGKLSLSGGPFVWPLGIAYDPATMTLWVADQRADRVRVVTPDGATAAVIDSVGGAPLVGPVDVAVDATAGGSAWVLVQDASHGGAPGEPEAAARYLHAFDRSARYLASYVPSGGGAGQLSRGGGLAVDAASRLYLADSFQGAVQVVSTTGAAVATIGAFGAGQGQLTNPTGLAVMANGDLAVANTTLGKIDRFGTGAPLPTCAGDSDCDGLPDDWEIANGLDPRWAGDALLDLDADGLNNVEEHAARTNPRNRDTDGDGLGDGDEVLAGLDPTVPNAQGPTISATGPAETPPGLVKLSAVASGPGTCAVSWAQAGGPAVTLRSPNGASTDFVAREAAAYEFDAVATCGAAASAPDRVRVVVRNAPPLADAGRVVVVSPGGAIHLDARASSDPNGDALTFSWDQTVGAPIIGAEAGDRVHAKARGAGLYAFQVTVTDAAGASATAEVPVIVAGGPVPTAIAAARPADAVVGAPVVLDASASLAEGGAEYAWQQVEGPPPATFDGADEAIASFTPGAAGRHAFEVSVRRGHLRSPPARVEVFVAEAGGALPAVTASAPSIVAANAPVALDAAVTGGAVTYAWRQVSGPAAGLTSADAATATAVPFAAGFYVFEVSVKDGAAEGHPARVAFEARVGGKAIPQARIAPVASPAAVGQIVFLDGRGSTGATGYRWTQVAGPWVGLGAQNNVTSFRPHEPGRYAFELEVYDDVQKVRSAPARVEVEVVHVEGVK